MTVRFIGTGSTGKVAVGSFLQDIKINGTENRVRIAVFRSNFFIIPELGGPNRLTKKKYSYFKSGLLIN